MAGWLLVYCWWCCCGAEGRSDSNSFGSSSLLRAARPLLPLARRWLWLGGILRSRCCGCC